MTDQPTSEHDAVQPAQAGPGQPVTASADQGVAGGSADAEPATGAVAVGGAEPAGEGATQPASEAAGAGAAQPATPLTDPGVAQPVSGAAASGGALGSAPGSAQQALPPGDTGPAAQLSARVNERPEIAVGGAFAGGLVLALILKRLAR